MVLAMVPVDVAASGGAPSRVRAQRLDPRAAGASRSHPGRLRKFGRALGRPFRAVGRGTRKLYRKAGARCVNGCNRIREVEPRTIRQLSTGSLLVSGAGGLMQITRAAGPLGGPFTGIGSVGLGYYSIRDLRRAKTTEKRIEAAHGLAWSMQGLTGLGYALQSKAAWLKPTSQVLGVAGGSLQAGIGAFRMVTGIREKSREKIVLGALDIGGGACWAASACALATPWTLGGFIALTTVRMGYEHRDAIRSAARKLTDRVKRKLRREPAAAPRPLRLRVPAELRLPDTMHMRLAM